MRSYLANDVRVGSVVLRVGKLVDDAVIDAARLVAAGAVLVPESPEVAAVAARVVARRALRGMSDEEASKLFLSAVVPMSDGSAASWSAQTSPIVADANGVISSAAPMTTATGSPLLIVDNVAGGRAVRTRSSDRLATVAGIAPYLVTGECTICVVCRLRTNGTNLSQTFFDTTDAGTRKGVQLQLLDAVSLFGRSIVIRQFDGSSFTDVTASLIAPGIFFPQNWCVFTVRMTATLLDVRVNGQLVWAGGIAIDKPYLDDGPGSVAIGGGAFDFKAWTLFKTWRTDAQVMATEAKLSAGSSTRLIALIAGDPTLLGGRSKSASFPYPSRLPNGRFYMTVYMGIDGPIPSDHNDAYVSDDAITWTFWKVETQSTDALRYSDLKTSEPLSDGSIIQVTFTYDAGNTTQPFTIWRRSTDSAETWSEWANADPGATPVQSFVSEAPREDPTQLGHLHMMVQTFETSGDATPPYRSKLWDYQTADAGSTWTRVLVADGVLDEKFYAEPGMRITAAGEMRVMIRDATVNGSTPMMQAHSPAGDHGATWGAPVDANVPGWSSGQQARILASGREVFIVRQLGSNGKAAIFWRAAGSAADDPWSVAKFDVDPTWGGMYYAGVLEPVPGRLVLVYARSGSINAGFNNSVGAQVIEEWMLDQTWPGDALPHAATVTSGQTRAIALSGAGDYECVFDSDATGSSVVVSGEHATFTAGSDANGDAVFHFTDVAGHVVQSCTYTVTGAPTNPIVTDAFPNAVKAGRAITFRLRGTHFDTGSVPAVTIAGAACTGVSVISGTSISAVTPVGLVAGGPYDVVVTYASGPNAGSGTLAASFDVFDAHLVAQFDDSSLQNTTSGGKLASALDLTGNGNVLHQLAGANQPALTASGMNGLPGVAWNNSPGSCLADSGTTSWGLGAALSVCTLVQTSVVANEQRLFGMQYNNFHGLLYTQVATGLLGYFTADITAALAAPVCDGDPHACVATLATVSSVATTYVDGVVGTPAASTTPFAAASGDHMAWGSAANSDDGVVDHPLSGFSPLVYVFDVALSGALLARVTNNLKRRGGIP